MEKLNLSLIISNDYMKNNFKKFNLIKNKIKNDLVNNDFKGYNPYDFLSSEYIKNKEHSKFLYYF